ncbi:glutathione reductase (NADPH) [Allopseudospirillum japonicum]|uniref:Glutathione reductase n=1 Tax=Allopseudospirillum japonicum TaxID=64971 RepID=A0A1H6S5T7_9GAMM|nr:glutathione-disulfide reductase [Allopseudospirillum japonicum]SEI63259.1 glutathione reductase (NADPH) [Allopseudospirillum japonicum]
MSQYDYQLLVIGAGSGGVRAARTAAALGVKVAVCEDTYLGGTCVNVGCVPKKLYSYAAHYGESLHEAQGFGWQVSAEVSFDWAHLREQKKTEIQRLNQVYRQLLVNSGVTLLEGRGQLVGDHQVKIGEQVYTAERVLLATGGWPSVPHGLQGRELAITSNEIFDLAEFPQRLVIVGGGYIAVEFASIFAGLGAETHLIYRGDLVLRGFDEDIRQHLVSEMRKKGVNLHFNTNIESLSQGEGGILAELTNGQALLADQVLYATGRQPKIQGLGLEDLGVQLNEKGAVAVNNEFQTNLPWLYALGDVIGRVQLTPVALAEAMALVKHLYQGAKVDLDYELIPTAVFTHPNIGCVGLTEQEARQKYANVKVYRSEFRALKHTLSGSQERTLMKMLVDQTSQKVLGLHMVGEDAGEIIQGMAVALKAGATKATFDATIGIHPTAAEEFVTMRD